MLTTTMLFCHGCNEKFAVSDADRVCPQCGQTLDELLDASTHEFIDLEARGTYFAGAQHGQNSDDELIGKRLSVYLIEAFLGKGGTARVYRATHQTLERPCAIKVLNPQLVQRNPDFIKAFFAEARAAASLIHPNVVTIHTIGQDNGLHFIEMEYVVGRSMHRFVESQQRCAVSLATHLMLQTCSALATAHAVGMIHRDLKPANVLVTESGVAKLADFGLAKRVVTANRSPSGRDLVGTPYFMAPELFDGQPAGKRSDIYAMGITYFYLLTGQLPFVNQSVTELARKHARDPVPDMAQLRADLPADAIAVTLRCMAKNPEDRYADATELGQDLKSVYGGLRTLESLVREGVAGLDIECRSAADRIDAHVRLPNGRSQTVHIEACSGAAIADRIIKIYSVCAPAVESYFRRALELNAAIPHGSVAIEQINGEPHFVMGNTYPRGTCDPEEIRRSVLSISQHADEVERVLTGGDRH